MAHLPPVRRMRRRERTRRRRFLAGASVALLLIAVSLLHLSRTSPVVTTDAATPAAETLLAVATEPVGADADPTAERPIYPFSIIEGGASTPDALRNAIETDPVVRTHFASFNVAKTHVVRLTRPRVAHVSYRKGNDVFWTRRPLLLKEGETLLTDGVHYARTRCGNQLALSPAVVAADEPSPEVFDTPLPSRKGARLFPAVSLPMPATGSSGPVSADRGRAFPGGGIPSTRGGLIGSVVAGPGPISVEGDSSPFPPAVRADTPPIVFPPNPLPSDPLPRNPLPSDPLPRNPLPTDPLPPHALPPNPLPPNGQVPPDDPKVFVIEPPNWTPPNRVPPNGTGPNWVPPTWAPPNETGPNWVPPTWVPPTLLPPDGPVPPDDPKIFDDPPPPPLDPPGDPTIKDVPEPGIVLLALAGGGAWLRRWRARIAAERAGS